MSHHQHTKSDKILEYKLVEALERVKKMVIISEHSKGNKSHNRNKHPEGMVGDNRSKCRSHNSPKAKTQHHSHTKSHEKLNKMGGNAAHTQSSGQFKFPSPSQLHKNAHTEMLERELALFRREVESKYRASFTNSSYQYPRKFTIIDELPEEGYSTCIYIYIYIIIVDVIPCSIYAEKSETAAVPKNSESPTRLSSRNSNEPLQQYFSTRTGNSKVPSENQRNGNSYYNKYIPTSQERNIQVGNTRDTKLNISHPSPEVGNGSKNINGGKYLRTYDERYNSNTNKGIKGVHSDNLSTGKTYQNIHSQGNQATLHSQQYKQNNPHNNFKLTTTSLLIGHTKNGGKEQIVATHHPYAQAESDEQMKNVIERKGVSRRERKDGKEDSNGGEDTGNVGYKNGDVESDRVQRPLLRKMNTMGELNSTGQCQEEKADNEKTRYMGKEKRGGKGESLLHKYEKYKREKYRPLRPSASNTNLSTKYSTEGKNVNMNMNLHGSGTTLTTGASSTTLNTQRRNKERLQQNSSIGQFRTINQGNTTNSNSQIYSLGKGRGKGTEFYSQIKNLLQKAQKYKSLTKTQDLRRVAGLTEATVDITRDLHREFKNIKVFHTPNRSGNPLSGGKKAQIHHQKRAQTQKSVERNAKPFSTMREGYYNPDASPSPPHIGFSVGGKGPSDRANITHTHSTYREKSSGGTNTNSTNNTNNTNRTNNTNNTNNIFCTSEDLRGFGVNNINIQINSKIKMNVQPSKETPRRSKTTVSSASTGGKGVNAYRDNHPTTHNPPSDNLHSIHKIPHSNDLNPPNPLINKHLHHVRGKTMDDPKKININISSLLSTLNMKSGGESMESMESKESKESTHHIPLSNHKQTQNPQTHPHPKPVPNIYPYNPLPKGGNKQATNTISGISNSAGKGKPQCLKHTLGIPNTFMVTLQPHHAPLDYIHTTNPKIFATQPSKSTAKYPIFIYIYIYNDVEE